jgi:spermidine/putrescine-binding protein
MTNHRSKAFASGSVPPAGPTGFIDRRAFLGGSLGVAALAALAACSSSGGTSGAKGSIKAAKDGDTLNLYAWEGYFAPTTIKGFEKKYGITVKQTATASSADQLQKITSEQPFDVTISNSTFLPQVTSAGLLHVIDHDQLKNFDQVIPYFQSPYFDPGAKYSIGYAMAPVGIAYRKSEYPNLTGSWKDFWNNVTTVPKHAYYIDDMQLGLSIALMYLGLDLDTDSQSDLNKAVSAISSIKGELGGFGSTNTIQSLSSGQATLIPSYTGNVYTALTQAKNASDLGFELCKEGQLFNDDAMSIPIKAAHPGNGMLFIDYMLAPENMTANVKYIGYPVPTKAGLQTYDTLVKATPFLAFGTSLLSKPSAWEKGLSPQQRTLWNAAWLKVQAS